MTKPLIHLNGTHRDDLYVMYSNAVAAVREAQRSLVEASPNARDYYLTPGAIRMAEDEHAERMRKLGVVVRELEELLAHVADAPGPGR
jgi:hypothetical protein